LKKAQNSRLPKARKLFEEGVERLPELSAEILGERLMKATHIEVGNLSDLGVNPAREKNEDYFGRFDGEFGTLLIVCDGMGGHIGGEIASRLAVEAIQNYIAKYHIPTEENMIIAQSIEHAQQKIMEAVNDDPSLSGMGSTLVMLLIREHQFWYAHLGDSRLYLRRDDAITRLTRDHSEVQNLVDLGVIKPEDARTHPRRSVLSKALGHDTGDPEISGPHMLYQDDVFLLCTDGLTEYLEDHELLDYMTESPQVAAHNLVEEAKRRGGMDNITVQVIRVLHGTHKGRTEAPAEVSNRKQVNYKKYLVPALAVILGLYILAMIPRTCRKVFDRKPMTHEDSLRVAEKARIKQEKAEQKRLAKEAKQARKQDKDAPAAQPSAQVDPALDSALAARLSAKPASADYQKFLDELRAANPSAKLPAKISFISDQTDGRSVLVTPGQTIYFAWNYLDKGNKLNMEQLQYLITIAAAMGDASIAKSAPANAEGYFSGSPSVIDEATLANARKLWVAAKPAGDYDFTRIGRSVNKNARKSGYTLIYTKPAAQ